MQALADDFNAALRALGLPEGWLVEVRDETSLSLMVEGETWGYRFVEVRGEIYTGHVQGKERRWKMRTTVIDRLSKHVLGMYEARQEYRARLARIAEVQNLLSSIPGLRQSAQGNIFHVAHTDCRFWVYPERISIESRNFGLYRHIESGPEELDLVITDRVKRAVEAVTRVQAEVVRASATFKEL